MKALTKIYIAISAVLSVYGISAIILFLNGFISTAFKYGEDGVGRIILQLCFVMLWFILGIIAKLEKGTFLTLPAMLSAIYVFPFNGYWKLIPLALALILFIRQKYKNWIIFVLGIVLMIVSFLIIMTIAWFQSFIDNPHPEDIVIERYTYLSENGKNAVDIELVDHTISGTYGLYVFSRQGCSVDLGLKKYVKMSSTKIHYNNTEEIPEITFEWIDNDTFVIDGNQYKVSDYLE